MNEQIAQGLLQKAAELNESPLDHITSVSEIISSLQNHIDGSAILEKNAIETQVQNLTVYTYMVPVPIPLNSGVVCSRAVKYTEVDGNNCYPNVSRLSYIPLDSGIAPNLGRLNEQGVSLFYASLNADANSIGAILSEVRAKKNEIFNVLQCRTKLENPANHFDLTLNVAPLGISDYFRRGVPAPFLLNKDFENIYVLLKNNTHPAAMLAMQLCDAFLSDVLKRSETKRLYEVTAAIGKECLKPNILDGILYPSTKFDGFPNIALKPTSVDKKLRCEYAASIKIIKEYGYGMYQTKILHRGAVANDEIVWD
jgi:hypothetical protein